jgi:hypothetical protein
MSPQRVPSSKIRKSISACRLRTDGPLGSNPVGRMTAFSSTWNPPRKGTRQIRRNCVRKCLVNASTQAGFSLRKKSRRGKEMRGVTRFCEPFVAYVPREPQCRSPRKFTTVLCRTSIRLRGERSTASPVSSGSKSQHFATPNRRKSANCD